jgi:CubicO group peptidase (beta-lactamase class C family)
MGYGLLGYVIERKTNQKLDVLLEQKILHPLGLKNTGYAIDLLSGRANRAYGHVGDQPKFIHRGERMDDWSFPELMKGSAGVYSNARDLLMLAAAHLNEKDTKLNQTLSQTLQVRFARQTDAHAIAWFADDIDNQRITYQVGMVAGFSSYLGMDVKQRTAVVVLQNSLNWGDRVGLRLLLRLTRAQMQRDATTQETIRPLQNKTAHIETNDVIRYVGIQAAPAGPTRGIVAP